MKAVFASVLSLAVATLWGCPAESQPQAPRRVRIELHEREGKQAFTAVGLTSEELAAFDKLPAEQQAGVLTVYVEGVADPPPIGGALVRQKDTLQFTPRYPLDPGQSYRARLDRAALSSTKPVLVTAEYAIPPRLVKEPTAIKEVYPTADRLPENQLKFYIHFSAPMAPGDAYRHIHLLDDAGKEVDAPFLELAEELWDPEFRRFTLLFDPGRVKRGLKPREEVGPVLEEGKRYTLAIDSAWPDANRRPLAKQFKRTFTVGPPDDAPLDPAQWKLQPPGAGTDDPIVIRFGEPVDQALASRIIRVEADSGEQVLGEIELTDHQATWNFRPDQPWVTGSYRVVAETTLEDLAGNAIGRPFEIDQFDQVDEWIEKKTVELPFEVK